MSRQPRSLAHRWSFISILAVAAAGCAPHKLEGFGLEGSPIRYRAESFADPEILAQVGDLKFTRAQILDKSPVIKDLDQQASEARVALAYMKAVEKAGPGAKGKVETALPKPDKPLDQLLARFGHKPSADVGIDYGAKLEEGEAARLGKSVVKADDVDESNAVMQSIERRRFDETLNELDHQLSRILLNEAAQKAKIPLQRFIDEKVSPPRDREASESELKAHLNKIGFAESELTPELRQQFMTSLSQAKEQRAIEAFVAKNELREPVRASVRPPEISIRLSDDWKPIAGYADAPIAMVAFSGTTCPDCPPFVRALKGAMNDYDGYAKLNWIHNFNLDDGVARMMAQAALCVESVKRGRSLDFMGDFAEKAATIDENAFYEWARGHGVDEASFKTCFVEQKQNALLNQHLQYARRAGIVANPSLWIEGKMLAGVIKQEDIARELDRLRAEKQASPLSAFWRRTIARFTGR